jgi:hypothetical protein
MDVPLSAVVAIVGMLVAVVGSLIVVNLRAIKSIVTGLTSRLNQQDSTIGLIATETKDCKVDCERRFVSSELFLRETGYQRRAIEVLTAAINRLDGKLTVVEQLPQIAGKIAREVVHEMKNGETADV